ncbi:hypothetical protein E3Q23_01703 [Wallemia mellicola]|nr:hypothetical protein E3Q23_01703 [Wallemia mellicola]
MAKIFKQISHIDKDMFLLSFTTNLLNQMRFVQCKRHHRAYNSYQSKEHDAYNHVRRKITKIKIRFKLGPIIKSTQTLIALYDFLNHNWLST